MSFANPQAFLAAIPLAALIVALYLLKMRRRDIRVPATFLWPARTEEVRANALFQKLRPNWLLFLQLLALAAATFALARPQIRMRGLTGEVTVIVVDASASMGATDVKPDRFEVARRKAREIIESAQTGDRLSLIEAGPTPRVIFPLSNDSARQVRSLEDLRRSDADTDMGEALRLAAAISGDKVGARIVLLSDGDFSPVTDFSRGKAALVYQSIGSHGDNLAISALGTTDSPEGRQLYVAVRNFGKTPMKGAVSLYGDGKLLDSIPTGVIGPAKQWGQTLSVGADTSVFEAKLDSNDVLAADNYGVTVAGAGANLRVLLVGPPDPFTERALALDPRVTLDRAAEIPPEETGPPGGSKYDIVVFDGKPGVPVRARGVLYLGDPGSGGPATASEEVKSPQFVDGESVPLLKGVDFREVFIDAQFRLNPKKEAEVLAQTSVGPLLVSQAGAEQRQLALAFAPLDSDFPLQVSFPIFVANALDFLAGGRSQTQIAVRAGSTFSVPTAKDAELVEPKGQKMPVRSNGSMAIVRDLRQVGKHELRTTEAKREVFAYLRSDRESDVAPVSSLPLSGGQVAASASPLALGDFWRPAALLALLVLAGEWWLFARRS